MQLGQMMNGERMEAKTYLPLLRCRGRQTMQVTPPSSLTDRLPPSPHLRDQLAPISGDCKGTCYLLWFPSTSRSTSLNKALPGFLVWPHQLLLIKGSRTSMVVQWLRTHLPMQGARVPSLVQKDSTCREAAKPGGHNY